MNTDQLQRIRPGQMIPADLYVRWVLAHFPERIATKGEIADHMAAWRKAKGGKR